MFFSFMCNIILFWIFFSVSICSSNWLTFKNIVSMYKNFDPCTSSCIARVKIRHRCPYLSRTKQKRSASASSSKAGVSRWLREREFHTKESQSSKREEMQRVKKNCKRAYKIMIINSHIYIAKSFNQSMTVFLFHIRCSRSAANLSNRIIIDEGNQLISVNEQIAEYPKQF